MHTGLCLQLLGIALSVKLTPLSICIAFLVLDHALSIPSAKVCAAKSAALSQSSLYVLVQSAGLLISRKAHGAHHKAPFEGNYCIVSGLWNSALDQNGSDQGFFRRLEKWIAARTGVEPRCWYEPKYELEELPVKAQ